MAWCSLFVLGSIIKILFVCFLSLGNIFSISLTLNPIETTIHIIIFKMCSGVGTLVFFTCVIIKVDSFVVNQVKSSFILLVFILSSFVILGSSSLIVIRAILKIAILHFKAVNSIHTKFDKNNKYRILINFSIKLFKFKISI